jgi:hypothetical protein
MSFLGGREKKKTLEGVNSRMIYLISHKNFGKCYNVPPPCTTIKKKDCLGTNETRKLLASKKNLNKQILPNGLCR